MFLFNVFSDVKHMLAFLDMMFYLMYFFGLRACEGYDIEINITEESYFVSKYKNSLVLCYRIINKFLFLG